MEVTPPLREEAVVFEAALGKLDELLFRSILLPRERLGDGCCHRLRVFSGLFCTAFLLDSGRRDDAEGDIVLRLALSRVNAEGDGWRNLDTGFCFG